MPSRIMFVVFALVGLAPWTDGIANAVARQPEEKLATAAELFPLRKGAKWRYEIADRQSKNLDAVIEVLGTEVSDGTVSYRLHRTDDSGSKYDYYYSYKDSGLYYAGWKSNNEFAERFDPPVCILKDDSPQVQSWKVKTKGKIYSDRTEEVEHRVTQYRERITCQGGEVTAIVVNHSYYTPGFTFFKYDGMALKMPFFSPQRLPGMEWTTWHVKGQGVVKFQWQSVSTDEIKKSPPVVQSLASVTGLGIFTASSISVNKDDEEGANPVVVDSYRLEAGDSAKFKFSRTITRDVTLAVKAGGEVEVASASKLDLKLISADVSGRIKAAVEASTGTKFEASETREREITITNTTNKVREGRIVWIDTYRAGTIKITQDGKDYDLQFRFPTGTRLESRNKE
jgi:hypothetical protein